MNTALADELQTIPRDKESNVLFKPGQLVYLTREWSGFGKGSVFYVVQEMIPCASGPYLRWNVRAVTYDVYNHGQHEDAFHCRTLPAEILRWTPKEGDTFEVDRNQGNREAWCLGRIGTQALCAYQMPAGRWFLFIESTTARRDRPISMNRPLPQKWRDNQDVQCNLNNLGIA